MYQKSEITNIEFHDHNKQYKSIDFDYKGVRYIFTAKRPEERESTTDLYVIKFHDDVKDKQLPEHQQSLSELNENVFDVIDVIKHFIP